MTQQTPPVCPSCGEPIIGGDFREGGDVKRLWLVPPAEAGEDAVVLIEHRPARGCGKWLWRRHVDRQNESR